MTQEIRVMKPQNGFPINRTNGGSAGFVEVMAKPPGENMSHYVTGILLTEGDDGDGLTFIRRNSIKFEAAADLVTVSDNAALEPGTNDFSFVFGIKMTAGEVTLTDVIHKVDTDNGYQADVDASGHLVVAIGDGTAVTVTSLNPINDGYWHQVVVTCDRDDTSGLVLYIDGKVSQTANPSGSTGSITGGAIDLIFNGTNSKTFWLSTYAFYKATLLTAAQVTTMWRRGSGQKFTGSESGISVAFNTDEGTGSTWTDLVAANDGTVSNAPDWDDGDGLPIDIHTLKEIGKIACRTITTQGGGGGVQMTFPHAIKIGRNAPIRLNETDGAWNAIIFGYTDGA